MGLDRLTALWSRMRDSLWFLPTTMTLGAVILAMVTVRLDLAGVANFTPPEQPDGAPGALRILFAGSAEGARAILTTIAGGLITVTGVVFSVTIVALQLASTQFTPRILRNFTADRGNQVVLGVFISTFTYALLVQRVVRGAEDPAIAFVPNLSVTVAMALALISIAFLIFFIDHAAKSVQASVIIDRVAHDGMRILHRSLAAQAAGLIEDDVARHLPPGPASVILARASGYLQGVDDDALMDQLAAGRTAIRVEPLVGQFVMGGTPLVRVWPADADAEEALGEAVRAAFILGRERTPELDAELPVVELVDIAVKALSPGINDPTTATLCLDRLAQLIVEFGCRETPPRVHLHPETRRPLILPRLSFDHFVNTALDQIRTFGVGNPHFGVTMLRRLAEMGRLLPPERHPTLARHAEAVLRDALSREPDRWDRERLDQAAQEAFDVIRGV